MTAAPALAQEQIHSVPLTVIDESPFHHRRRWGNIEELAQSFRDVGVLQPATVRRVGERFELVYGHRRFRGAALSKLTTLPCIIRVLSDLQAAEMQAIENLQREDPHPMDEAEDFEQLGKLGWSPEEMAAKIGKSKAYVYGRLKLLELGPEARQAFYDGALSPSVALYVARVPAVLQPEALKVLDEEAKEAAPYDPGSFDQKTHLPKEGTYEALPAREAANVLRAKFTLRLAGAPFDRGDAELVAGACACAVCPKRSGNQTEIFAAADVSTPDLCTDPTCFAAKKKAAAAETIAKLERKGTTVLESKGERFGTPKAPAGYVAVNEYSPEIHKPWSEVLKGKKVAEVVEAAGRVVMLDAQNKPVQLVKKSDVLEAVGYDPKKASRNANANVYRERTPEEKAKAELEAKAEEAGENAAMEKIIAHIVGGGFTDPLVRVLAAAGRHDMRKVSQRRGWKVPGGYRAYDPPEAKKLRGEELLGFLAETILVGYGETFDAACDLLKIDLKALIKQEFTRFKAGAPAPAADAKKGGTLARKADKKKGR